MKLPASHTRRRLAGGSTLLEVLVTSTVFAVVLGAILIGFSTFTKTYTLARDYAMARLTLSDYINMDLRRSSDFQPTLVPDLTHGGWVTDDWTLPMVLEIPNYNQTNGTPNQPVKVSLTAAELAAAQEYAISRGKLPPPTWKVTYGSAATPRLVVYEQAGDIIVRREGWGSVTRPTANTVSWTWTGATPLPVKVAQGVIKIQGVYRVKTDLTPENLDELPPEDVNTNFKANYSIRYIPSTLSKAAPQINSVIYNNILLRTQRYGL